MLGVIYECDGNKQIAQVAGPRTGLIEMSEYENDVEYRVLLSNAPSGIDQNSEYTLGTSNTRPISYNPHCCVCDDEDGNPVYKGVLKVDILCSECTVGADKAEVIRQNEVEDNLYFNIPFWGNAESAQGYHDLNKSSAYNLTFNPATGNTCAKSFTAVSNVLSDEYCFPNESFMFSNSFGGITFATCDGDTAFWTTPTTVEIGEGYCLVTRRIVNTDGEYNLTINAGDMSTLDLRGNALTFNGQPIGTSSVNGNYTWASLESTPRACEVRQYLMNNGGVKARLDGTTLFLTTNNWT